MKADLAAVQRELRVIRCATKSLARKLHISYLVATVLAYKHRHRR